MPAIQNAKASSLQQRLVTAVRADPKKAGVLTLLVVILLTMWVRMWAQPNPGPRRAVAATSPAPTALRADGEADGGEVVRALAEWKAQPLPLAMGRNLFAADLDHFPRHGPHNPQTDAASALENQAFWDRVAKSMSDQADQRKERQVLVENLRLQAAKLRLQTTVMGAKPRAVINGELVGEGDVVASFRVWKIEARRVIVEREGIRLDIAMN
jgi:hypothetical protein